MPESKHPLKVFLCHASTDKPKVRELYRYLKRRGIQPWFDEEHLVGGQDWQVEIPKALATSDAIIICLTKNSVDKEGYIQKEIKFALDKALEMPEGRIFLIPVKFEECEVPFSLSRYQWVDLTVESGYAKMMKALKFRASQLERSTVEVSKKTDEEENLAREKKELEVTELAERERKEKELREKQGREAREKAKRDTEKKEVKPVPVKTKASSQFVYWFGGVIVLALGVTLLSSLNNTPSTPQPNPENTLTKIVITPTYIETVEPSATATVTVILNPTSTPVSTLTPTPLPTEIIDSKGVTMRLIPQGEFTMGITNQYWDPDANPEHTVFIEDFYLDKYEVTNALYEKCVDADVCEFPGPVYSYNRSKYYGNSQFEDYPVININWYQAKTYCEWRESHLPTEAEWEKAARLDNESRYPWGNFWDSNNPDCTRGNFVGCGVGDTTKVGIYEGGKSQYGVYDLIGNVEEWIGDWYSDNYYYSSPSSDPLGPNSGTERVLRGGSWRDTILPETIFRRSRRDPETTRDNIGFRCARDATP